MRPPARAPVAAAVAAIALAAAALPLTAAAAPLSKEECVKLLKTIGEHQRNTGDYKALVYLEQKERGKADLVYEAAIYRRDADQKLLILFLKPKSEQGKGYLRIDKNLWMYDPSVRKWERRTEREQIGGTGSRRSDFDEWRFDQEYDPEYEGEGTLGAFKVHRLKLTAKPGVEVSHPVMHLWIDQATGNVLKAQEHALSGRLMRTSYYPKWQKVYSEAKKADVWFPQEMRFYDEVEKANSTVVLVKSVDVRPLDPNLFTKAWLESKSR